MVATLTSRTTTASRLLLGACFKARGLSVGPQESKTHSRARVLSSGLFRMGSHDWTMRHFTSSTAKRRRRMTTRFRRTSGFRNGFGAFQIQVTSSANHTMHRHENETPIYIHQLEYAWITLYQFCLRQVATFQKFSGLRPMLFQDTWKRRGCAIGKVELSQWDPCCQGNDEGQHL